MNNTANSKSKSSFPFDTESAADKKDTAQSAAGFAFDASQASATTNTN
jgi:hypothetical protein